MFNFRKCSRLEEERIALLQEKERLNDKIHEQNRQLSDLKHDYELACSEVKRLADEISAKVEDCHIGVMGASTK